MKTIALEQGKESFKDNGGNDVTPDISTASLIEQALNIPPPGGFTLSVLKARRRVSDALDKALNEGKGIMEVEDSDFETLRNCVINAPWSRRGAFIENFVYQFA